MSTSLRVIFAGTPYFAAHHLKALLSSVHQVVGVFTQPDRPAGRGKRITLTPVKILAKEKGIPIFQPISLSLELQETKKCIFELKPDVIVVVAYGLIIPKEILEIPRFGCINVHGSLLPRWRGAAPIQRSLLAGDTMTGISIIKMEPDIDTGDILHQLYCPIYPHDTSKTLYVKLEELGTQGLMETLRKLVKGILQPTKQDNNKATYATKLSKEEARINWSFSSIYLERCIRAFNPWPMSWIKINEHIVKICKASIVEEKSQADPGTIIDTSKKGIYVATSDGILNLELLHPAGKNPINSWDLLNSHREWFVPGNRLF